MLTQVLDISNLKHTLLSGSHCGMDRRQLTIGEDIGIGKGRTHSHIRCRASDAMIEEDSPWFQQITDAPEIRWQHGFTDMLKHSHAGDFVKRRRSVEFPVIGHPDLTMIYMGFADTSLCKFCLFLAERDAQTLDTISARSVHDERAPATADIQETLP